MIREDQLSEEKINNYLQALEIKQSTRSIYSVDDTIFRVEKQRTVYGKIKKYQNGK